MEQSTKRDLSLDALRLISILGVIMIHTVSSAWWNLDMRSFDWQCVNFYDGLVRCSVPLFVMISGALMLRPDRTVTLRELYLKRIPRLFSAWVFWSFAYAARFLLKYLLGAGPDALSMFWTEFLNGHFHLWFMGMIIGLYIALPLLRPIAANRTLLGYFLILSLLFSVLFPSLGVIGTLKPAVEAFLGRFHLNLPLGYTFYFMLGYYLYTEAFTKSRRKRIYILGILGLAVTVLGTSLANLRSPSFGERLYDYMMPNVAFPAAAVFVFVRSRLSQKVWTVRQESFLKRASTYTFGVYLVHEWFNILLPHFGVTVVTLPPVIMAPLLAAAFYGFSYLISALLNRIPVVRDWLV